MKMIKYVLALVLFASMPVMAADIDGNWKGGIDSPNGSVEMKFTFKMEKDKLTGSMTGPDGTPVPIADGKLAGSQVTFSVSIDFGGNPLVIAYKGELVKDKLNLQMTFMDMPIAIVLTKS
jgi:hypothetical protein